MTLKQTDPRLDKYINKYGCLFMSIANAKGIEYTPAQLNSIWKDAIVCSIITGDMNHDGDLDDSGEAIIADHNKLIKLFGINMLYDNSRHPADASIPDGFYAIGEFYNPNTNFTHFAVIDKDKKVIYDPIANSRTVKEGHIKTIRLYKWV